MLLDRTQRFIALPLVFALVALSLCCLENQTAHAQDLPRILLGEETDDYESVGIVGSVQDGGFCTGTLISTTHVLTAAHCAEVIASATDGTFEVNGQIYGTSQIYVHDDYDPLTLANDIAILQLDEPVLDVAPSEIFRGVPLVGDLLIIVGYGATGTAEEGSDGTFGTKRFGITTIDEVTDSMVSWVFDDTNETNTAVGDSGGPGYLTVDGIGFIASITSGGTEPDSILGDFAFNTRVDAYADWIDAVVSGEFDVTDVPPTDEDESVMEEESSGCTEFWSQPFPFLQLLIDLLTSLLQTLNDLDAVESEDTTATSDEITSGGTSFEDEVSEDASAEVVTSIHSDRTSRRTGRRWRP